MYKVALVGLGGISNTHLPVWKELDDCELVAVCDTRPEQMDAYPDARHYTDFYEMLEKEKLDILDICVPTFLHTKFALAAMKKGIHVLCEKPVSMEVGDVELLYRTAEENHVKFMVAQCIRFWPEYVLLKEIYDTGRYGKLLSGEMERLGCYPKWSWDGWMMDEPRSGFVPFDLHIHDLDFVVYAFGAPVKVDHFRSKQKDQDFLHAVYSYPDFFISAEASWFAAPYPFHMSFRFQFEEAVVAYEGAKLSIYQRDGKVVCPFDDTDAAEFSQLPQSSGYANEIHYFYDCVRQNKPQNIVKKEEGGRHTPFHNHYRPQFYIRTLDVTGEITLPEGVEMVMPGDHVTINVKLINPVACDKGLRFAIREGGRTVGSGQITDILD